MKKYVSSIIPDAELGKINQSLDESKTFLEPYRVSLMNQEKVGLRTLGDGREGYANMVSRAANEHGKHLPKTDEPAELVNAIAYYNNLANLKVKILHLLEIVDDTNLALGADIMRLADSYAGHLQLARKDNSHLDEALAEIDEYNQRFGARAEEVPVVTSPTNTEVK